MRDDDARLLDMLLAAREAMAFVGGLTFPEFQHNRMAQLAILKTIEIVGEAASGISTDTTKAHPEIPWSGIIGCGTASYMVTSASTSSACGKPRGRTSPGSSLSLNRSCPRKRSRDPLGHILRAWSAQAAPCHRGRRMTTWNTDPTPDCAPGVGGVRPCPGTAAGSRPHRCIRAPRSPAARSGAWHRAPGIRSGCA